MARPRPRRAHAPLLARFAVPLALVGLGTTAVVALAATGTDATTATPTPSVSTPAGAASSSAVSREQRTSRSEVRTAPSAPATKKDAGTGRPTTKPSLKAAATIKVPAPAPAPKVTGTLYATDHLKIRVEPTAGSKTVTVVKPGTRLKVTRSIRHGYRYVSYDGRGRWVKDAYLAKSKPKAAERKTASASGSSGGVTMAPCSKGSSMESGLTKDAILVHRSVCASFSRVSSFGGTRSGGGFHATGQAVDCMISDSGAGWELARWVRAHARQLGVSEVIYSQKIWTVQRGSEGWRSMSDRGSATANHYDHVHVSVYGNRAS